MLKRLGLLVALTIAVATGLYGARALAQAAPAIRDPKVIDEAEFAPINGLDQWITIRGQDREKPVVLILHGGPGQAHSHLIQRMAPMEKDFVVVQWDQRGAGRTLAHAGGTVDPAVDLKTMVSDGLAVTDYLRRRLKRDRIVLLGFSWGSQLGVEMARARPKAYWAYVGTGQGAQSREDTEAWVYAQLLARAQAAGDVEGLKSLREAGPPPWNPEAAQKAYRASAPYRGPEVSLAEGAKAAFAAPHWTVTDVQALSRGRSAYKDTQLERDLAALQPDKSGLSLGLPVVVIEGADDMTTPAPFAEAWVGRLKAPKKAFVAIPNAGHQVLMTNNAQFGAALKEQLAKLGVKPD